MQLNFHSLEAVRPSLELVRSLCSDLQIPFFLHADVLAQADMAEAPVEADAFIGLAKSLLPR